jgi:hypothetical protein
MAGQTHLTCHVKRLNNRPLGKLLFPGDTAHTNEMHSHLEAAVGVGNAYQHSWAQFRENQQRA